MSETSILRSKSGIRGVNTILAEDSGILKCVRLRIPPPEAPGLERVHHLGAALHIEPVKVVRRRPMINLAIGLNDVYLTPATCCGLVDTSHAHDEVSPRSLLRGVPRAIRGY